MLLLLLNQPGGAAAFTFPPPVQGIYQTWEAPASTPYQLLFRKLGAPASGPLPSNPPFNGGYNPAIQINWIPPVLAPIVGARLNPPISGQIIVPFPFPGTRITREVLQNWEVPPPLPIYARAVFTLSGPVVSLPPPGGGSYVRQSILMSWAPLVPAPIVAKNLTTYPASTIFVASTRIGYVPAEIRVGYPKAP